MRLVLHLHMHLLAQVTAIALEIMPLNQLLLAVMTMISQMVVFNQPSSVEPLIISQMQTGLLLVVVMIIILEQVQLLHLLAQVNQMILVLVLGSLLLLVVSTIILQIMVFVLLSSADI